MAEVQATPQKRIITCSLCHTQGHNRRSCREAPRWRIVPGNEHTFPPGKYWMGDICYIKNNYLYYNIWGDVFHFRQGYFTDDTHTFGLFNTRCGNGEYRDNYKNFYLVDAGVIGLIPFELTGFPEETIHYSLGQRAKYGGVFIDSTEPVVFRCNLKGGFVCTYGDKEIVLDTTVEA